MTQAIPRATRVSIDLGWLGLGLACVIGVVTRFWHLGAASLYTDEAFTFAMSGFGVPALLHNLTISDFHPPLFYLATHYLMGTLRWPLWDYRYLTAPFGILTIIATWGAARRMFDGSAAAVSAIVVALSPALIAYDRIYRMYAVLVALATLSWWVLVEAERSRGRMRALLWATYAVLAVILAYTHYLGFLVLACQALYSACRWQTNKPAFVACVLVAFSYVPWIGHLRQQLPLGGLTLSRPGFDVGLAASLGEAFAMGTPDSLLSWPSGAWVPCAVVGIVVLAASWLGRRSVLPFWMGALPLAIVASVVFGTNLAFFPRYLLIDVPPVAIGVGLITSSLAAQHARVAAWAVGLAIAAFSAVGASNVLLDPYYQFPNWYAVNALMLQHEEPGDAIVLDAGYERLVVQNYTAFRGRMLLSFMNPTDFTPIELWIRDHPHARVWYIEHQYVYWDPDRHIASALARKRPQVLVQRFARQAPVNDVTVLLFDKVPMTK